jgi:hypothetical protein
MSWDMQDIGADVQHQARTVIGRMTRDLRTAQDLDITQDGDHVDISFTRGGDAVTYAWTTDAGGTQNQLIRTDAGGPVITGRNVSALSLTETATDIKISLTISAQSNLKRTADYSLVGNVAKR